MKYCNEALLIADRCSTFTLGNEAKRKYFNGLSIKEILNSNGGMRYGNSTCTHKGSKG